MHPTRTQASLVKAALKPRRRGFILLFVVGMLVVLAVLAYSYLEQSRADLMGAANSRDLGATDALAQAGFEMALRALADDRSVWSANNPGWDTSNGPGWTSRFNYNPLTDISTQTAPLRGLNEPLGAAPNSNAMPFSRTDPKSMLDSWAVLFWNEEVKNSNSAFGYSFTFDAADPKQRYSQRHPSDPKMLLDTWPLQPFARVKKFRIQMGSCYGIVQIAITPKDGGIDLNDVFDPGTVTERPGYHDSPLYGGKVAADPYASPDRRTLEFILGRPPEYSYQNWEITTTDDDQYGANQPAGSMWRDNGVYNFRSYFEPSGRGKDKAFGVTAKGLPQPNYAAAATSSARLSDTNPAEPQIFYNAGCDQTYRYNYEAPRYLMWIPTQGFSQAYNFTSNWTLMANTGNQWFTGGRYNCEPATNPKNGAIGNPDALFHGFGFDLQNPKRGGINNVGNTTVSSDYFINNGGALPVYYGAGVYGHPKPRTFQLHFVPAVAGGRFWTDLEANWYFGGAPGFTSHLGNNSDDYSYMSNWLSIGSAYDSLGVGTQWMPPSSHMWSAASGSNASLSTAEIAQGLQRYPGNMPPAKPAATYTFPLHKWDDDYGVGNAHFTFSGNRVGIRAYGIQENWGKAGADDANGRFYDAIDINVTNFQVIYGLLTPEKIPSMMNRTTVAANLHWKSRLLDGAYRDMEKFTRYNPNTKPDALKAYDPFNCSVVPPASLADPDVQNALFGHLTNENKPYDPTTNPVVLFDPQKDILAGTPGVGYVGPSDYRFSIHRHYDPAPTPGVANQTLRIFGKMDFSTPDPRTGLPADDVFPDCHYDLSLSPNSTNKTDALATSSMAPRPDLCTNWPAWFAQRRAIFPTGMEVFKPTGNKPPAMGLDYPEGISGASLVKGGHGGPEMTNAAKWATPHPIYGLPNPDYLLLYPGTQVNYYWADQFRRYLPTVYTYPAGPAGAPGAPPKRYKLVDEDVTTETAAARKNVYPDQPTPPGTSDNPNRPFVPGIGKDDAWRVTRIGRKYQEIIADEIMDYQLNPWWPSPCAHNSKNGEIAVPLDRIAYPCEARAGLALCAAPTIFSYDLNKGKAGIDYALPDYFTTYNRFWMRACGKYTRNWAGPATDQARGEPYRASTAGGVPMNPVENRGLYPQAFQYFGQEFPIKDDVKDRILDFPYNTLEDQQGGDWRYQSGAVYNMQESSMRIAPLRNHPFKNWADFVAFLGHMVYRPPSDGVFGGTKFRDKIQGVDAWTVCNGPGVDARNQGRFFDGSAIAKGAGEPALPDALQGPVGALRNWNNSTVARDRFWPISANYGEFPTQTGPKLYPDMVAPWTDQKEWERRVDELRGRDAAGLRVEHNYISERAANDILVSLSNGRVGPIDFNGDGVVEMTRKDELPAGLKPYWAGFPWHVYVGADPTVKTQTKSFNTDKNSIDYGILAGPLAYAPVDKSQIIQECVTLPIKFRSNTFRVTVVVELTDPDYKTVFATRQYSRVYSRVPGPPQGNLKVHGPYTGEFILHGQRDTSGIDPENSFLGTD